MPYCACFHNYARDPDGLGEPLHPEDAGDILPGALGMQDGRASVELLALLKDRLVVRLGSNVDECYALGPYKVRRKSTSGLVNARYGAALHKVVDSPGEGIGREGNKRLLETMAVPVQRPSEVRDALQRAANRRAADTRQMAMAMG